MPFPPSPSTSSPVPAHEQQDVPGTAPADLAREVDRLRAELAHAHARLAEEIEARERATHAAEAAADARDQFISSVSHELRTPLSAILLWSSLIDEQQVNDPELTEALSAIKRSAEEQGALIDDIVDTSRLLAGKLRLEPESVDVAGLAREALARIAGDASEQGLAVVQHIGPALPALKADARRLLQLVTYLLRNAVKFTPRGGRITLSVQARPTDHELEFKVSDTGAGIDAARLAELFTRQPRLQGKCARSEIGLGLGLLLADRLTQLHGGRLTAESPGLGGGATFTVRLPLPASPQHPASGGPARVLVVLAAGSARAEVCARVEAAGAEPVAVDSFEAAEAAAREGPVSLIIADVDRSDGGGLDSLARIRAGGVGSVARTPAIALLPAEDPTLLERALETGFQTALALPVDPGELTATLEALLRPPSGTG